LDKIRIYLQSYDHKLLDQSAKKIAEVAKNALASLNLPSGVGVEIKQS